MKELITRPQADALIVGIAALGVIAAIVAALWARRRGLNPAKAAAQYGGPLLLCAALWPLYNAIEDHFGLDSVAALAINAGIFAALGVAIGVGWTKVFKPAQVKQSETALPQE